MITRDGNSLILKLYLQPNARVDCWAGLYAEALKVKITAPAVDERANAALCQFLAQQFRVSRKQVVLEKGQHGRHKRIRILAPSQLPTLLTSLVGLYACLSE